MGIVGKLIASLGAVTFVVLLIYLFHYFSFVLQIALNRNSKFGDLVSVMMVRYKFQLKVVCVIASGSRMTNC